MSYRAERTNVGVIIESLRTRAEQAEAERDELRRRQTEPDESDPDGWIRRSALNHWHARAIKAEAERDEARAAADRAAFAARTTGADLLRIGALCGMTDDEYPLKAVERVVSEVERLRAAQARRCEFCGAVPVLTSEGK